MKYHFTTSKRPHSPKSPHRRFVYRGIRTVKPIRDRSLRLDPFWDPPALPKGRSKKSSFLPWLKKKAATVGRGFSLAVERMAGDRAGLVRLCGTLCAAILITVLTGGILAISLFGRYNRPSTSVPVPNFLQQNIDTILSETEEPFSLIVQYEYNEGYAPGAVISQSPGPGVIRRLYGKDDRLTVTLTVCREPSLYTLPAFVGQSRRDAALTLRQAGMTVALMEEYSDQIPAGSVIRTFPQAGEHLKVGSQVTLTVSLGKEKRLLSLPDLRDLSENAARELLNRTGFSVGEITYQASEQPLGTVILQDYAAGSLLPQGSTVSFTVSSGQASAHRIPNLFGMTVDEARRALRAVGLTVGRIEEVAHAADSGTVIAQSIPPDTPITSAITAVDLTVSQ